MQGPATRRPPFFMQEDNSILHRFGARFTVTAAPRIRPEDFRVLRFGIDLLYHEVAPGLF